MAPAWSRLAKIFESEPSVVIAKIDAASPESRRTANNQGIKSYPTIKYFAKGSHKPVIYSGPRTEADLVNFVNRQAGTRMSSRAKAPEIREKMQVIESAANEIVSATAAARGFNNNGRMTRFYTQISNRITSNAAYLKEQVRQLSEMMKGNRRFRTVKSDRVDRMDVGHHKPKGGKAEKAHPPHPNHQHKDKKEKGDMYKEDPYQKDMYPKDPYKGDNGGRPMKETQHDSYKSPDFAMVSEAMRGQRRRVTRIGGAA